MTVPTRISRERRAKIIRFVRETSAEDIAGIQVNQGEVGKPTHPGKGSSRHGGRPPADYSIVEDLADLDLAVKNDNWPEAQSLYHSIRRRMGG